jgi:predicted nucleotidyltransferase
VYLFGSARYDSDPRDVDLLLVYDRRLSPSDAIRLRTELVGLLSDAVTPPLDVALLSLAEAADSNFVRSEGALLVHGGAIDG